MVQEWTFVPFIFQLTARTKSMRDQFDNGPLNDEKDVYSVYFGSRWPRLGGPNNCIPYTVEDLIYFRYKSHVL